MALKPVLKAELLEYLRQERDGEWKPKREVASCSTLLADGAARRQAEYMVTKLDRLIMEIVERG